MAFPRDEISKLLADCHRRCCICHRFCGVKMEIDHITPLSDDGTDDIDNAIAVCFECHAEIHLYNDKHPRGRKFRPDELRLHREQWLELCRRSAQFLASVPPTTDVGPVQALIDELEFNARVASRHGDSQIGALLQDTQFERCIAEGTLAVMEENVKTKIFDAYVFIKRANGSVVALANFGETTHDFRTTHFRARDRLRDAMEPIQEALEVLKSHLRAEP